MSVIQLSEQEQLRREKLAELIMMVTPEITMPLSADDPKPELQQPVELLKRMDLKDIQPDSKPAKKTKAARARN